MSAASRPDDEPAAGDSNAHDHPETFESLAAAIAAQQAEIAALRRELAEQKARNCRLELHDDIRATDIRDGGERIIHLQQQIFALVETAAPRRELAEQEVRYRRLEEHDDIRATDIRDAGERIVHLQQQISALVEYCHRAIADLTPPDLAGIRRRIAVMIEHSEPIPDDLQERVLRLELRQRPFDTELTRSLVALLNRLGRPPLPDPPIPEADGAPEPAETGIAALLQEADRCADDRLRVLACLWQVVVRYPHSARGWGEYARHFAHQNKWEYCRVAAQRILAHGGLLDDATAEATLAALAALAANGGLDGLAWNVWFERLPAALQASPEAADLLVWNGERDRAAALLSSMAPRSGRDASYWIVSATIAYEAEQWDDAAGHWRRALEADFPRAVRAALVDNSSRFATTLYKTGRAEEFAEFLTDRSAEYEHVNLLSPLPTEASRCATLDLRERAIERGLPSIVFVSQGKSASVSVGSLFNHGFGLVSVCYSLANLCVIVPWLADYLRGGACHVTHLDPSERNVRLLAEGGAKTVMVNVRDPRQLVVSMVGHFEKYPMMIPPRLRSTADTNSAVAAVIDEYYPEMVGWIDDWVAARSRLEVAFTTFEEFVTDRHAFVERCLALYGGDRRYFDRETALTEQPGVDYHRRLGATDEWRSVLTAQQIEILNRQIPERLWTTFGWVP
jgi:tetratricopeptide (TPR) repeat protein